MKYYKYLPTIVGCVGLIILLLTIFFTNAIVNPITSLGVFILGIVITMYFGLKGWIDDQFTGLLGLLINLTPLCLLGFVLLNNLGK
jgi:hypothetical protein